MISDMFVCVCLPMTASDAPMCQAATSSPVDHDGALRNSAIGVPEGAATMTRRPDGAGRDYASRDCARHQGRP